MCAAQIGIQSVLRVTLSVIVQFRYPFKRLMRSANISFRTILVDVISQMDHSIHIIPLRDLSVTMEVTIHII